MEKVIADLPKNAHETLRIELAEFRSHNLVSLRLWVPKADTGEMIPTAKGINVNIAMLPAIISALTEAERQARAAGLVPDEKART